MHTYQFISMYILFLLKYIILLIDLWVRHYIVDDSPVYIIPQPGKHSSHMYWYYSNKVQGVFFCVCCGHWVTLSMTGLQITLWLTPPLSDHRVRTEIDVHCSRCWRWERERCPLFQVLALRARQMSTGPNARLMLVCRSALVLCDVYTYRRWIWSSVRFTADTLNLLPPPILKYIDWLLIPKLVLQPRKSTNLACTSL